MEKAQEFAGRTAIVSGALGDIGRAICLELARKGADIAMGDLQPATEAARLISEIGSLGRNTHYRSIDIADPKAVQAWVQEVEKALSSPTLVVANAAVVHLAKITEVTAETWQRELDVNVSGCFYMAQAATQKMLSRKLPGRIVFIGSWAGGTPNTHIPSYCVSKAALRMLSRCMALDLAPHDILVNEIAPGYVNAGFSKAHYDKNPQDRERDRKNIPIQKHIQPEDVAAQVAHLCSRGGDHMTGSTLLMDGGLSMLSAPRTDPAD